MLMQSDGTRPARGSVNLEFWNALRDRRRQGDPQRRRVYRWQHEVLNHLQREPLLGQAPDRTITQRDARRAALAYLEHLWVAYVDDFSPYYTGVPYLRVGFAVAVRRRRRRRRPTYGAYAVAHRHEIYCRLEALNRATLVHEVCHLFAWGDGHGPRFCAALAYLWEREFGIGRTGALEAAARLDVHVDPPPGRTGAPRGATLPLPF
jgi:hypothetical protein